jgi:hypothetical protein
MRRIVITAAALGLVLGAAACGSAAGQHSGHPATHPAAATRTTDPVSPEVAADKALCKVWSANIGNDDLAITQAVTGAESPKLVQDINKACRAGRHGGTACIGAGHAIHLPAARGQSRLGPDLKINSTLHGFGLTKWCK